LQGLSQFLQSLYLSTYQKVMKKTAALFLLAALVLAACTSPSVETYLDFLYDNLSLPDRTDYSRKYYTNQVNLALQARAEMPWGNSVPEREFRHFVLPPRVNNEDLDTCRAVFFRELKPRLQGLSMQEAILEVNHWCHEHVTYRPTNARTLSPLATLRTAYGRCGEESVFLVAVLRSVGIPARQVYTPRWAHTDDNHAWVEAWADGRWWFLGACEPEPVLNMGWFNESASRGMLMHTRVFGNYDGPEEVVSQQYGLTEINVIENYAPTRRLTVQVLDSLERPVPDATVEFKVYNYAEFYTVARKQTDASGLASLTAGLGDMLVWATSPAPSLSHSPSPSSSSPDSVCGGFPAAISPSLLAFRQVSFARDSLVTLHLRRTAIERSEALPPTGGVREGPFDITPPAVSANLPTVTPKQREENNRRLALEDSIRHAYEATMTDLRSRGNHAVITAFLDSAAALGQQALAESLLAILPDKDLQDITLDVLLDNLPSPSPLSASSSGSACGGFAAASALPTSVAHPYLLSPRIERERLTAYKAPLRAAFAGFDVHRLIAWTRDSLSIIDDQNPQRLRMQPLGVFRTHTADRLGRDIFFAAACRSIGIPARINEINGKVQYYDTTWTDVTFDTPSASAPDGEVGKGIPSGTLLLTYVPTSHIPDPKYYTHFTLSRLDEQNRLQLLTYPEEATFQNTFAAHQQGTETGSLAEGVTLDAGTYLLTTGVRLADGSVRAHLQFFNIQPDATTTLPLTLRSTTDAVAVIGSLNAENLYQPLTPASVSSTPLATSASTSSPASSPVDGSPSAVISSPDEEVARGLSLLSTCGRGYYCLGLIAPNQEPTNHALRDIALVRSDFEQWGRKLVLLFDSPASAARFNFAEFSPQAGNALPSTTVWGCDIEGTIQQEVIEQLHLSSSALPIFLICDSFNRVVFVQQGYTIGLGEQLLKVIHQL
jgi:transglutaminase-like putative cysteine protease